MLTSRYDIIIRGFSNGWLKLLKCMTADHKITLHNLLSHTVVPSPPLEFTVDITYWQYNKNVELLRNTSMKAGEQALYASSSAGDNWSGLPYTLVPGIEAQISLS